MRKAEIQVSIAEDVIISKIHYIRGKQVMLSQDLAELYEVETRVLNQQVKRNIGKFPLNYMFQLSRDEYNRLISQDVILKRGQHVKYLPYAFTEHGILMLSSVLYSKRADKVNMMIIDTFIRLREILFINKDVLQQLEKVQSRIEEHDKHILVILEYLNHLEQVNHEETDFRNRKRIGFKIQQNKNDQ